jgi:hypothetical protein
MSSSWRDVGDLESGAETLAYDQEELEVSLALAEASDPELVAAGEPAWWEKAYPGGPPVGPSALPRPLYFPGNPSGKPPSSDGPDVLAIKRALWRGGRWMGPASRFDDTYSQAFAQGSGPNVVESGVAGFQRQSRIEPDSGQIGDETYQTLRYARIPDGLPNAGEPLFDATAINLLEQAAKPKPPSSSAIASAIADYCRRTIANEPIWHYRQARPMTTLGVKPEAGGYSDCSEHATAAYFWAGAPDPNGRGFDGYGYTGTLVNNPRVSSPYKVGDLALYGASTGSTSHVCTCYGAGDAGSSVWCSHGSEGAPVAVALHYRGDLLCVVRPGLS